MNLVLYHLVGGQGWYSCGLYFLLATLLDVFGTFDQRPRLRRVFHFFMVLAIPLGALTGTPLALWLAVPLTIAACAHAAFGFTNTHLRLRRISALVVSCLLISGLALELPWYIGSKPPREGPPSDVYILGDSLSAGGFGESEAWPKILAGQVPARIHNLSSDGATVTIVLTEVAETVRSAPVEHTRVFIELGGNDMLGGTPLAEFERSLGALLEICRGDPRRPRTVVMMELPIMFGKWGFGAAQRRLAQRYGVVLIPKRVLARLVLSKANTGSDRLHLSQTGHDRFARVARTWLGFE